MTISVELVIGVILGIVVGWLMGWWWTRGHVQGRADLLVAEAESRRLMLLSDLAHQREKEAVRAAEAEARAADLQVRLTRADTALQTGTAELQTVREQNARLETEMAGERRAFSHRLVELKEAEERLGQAFASLSAKALEDNNARFLTLASTRFDTLKSDATGALAQRETAISGLVGPMKEALEKIEHTLAEVERARGEDKGRLAQELGHVAEAQQGLRDETNRLTRALQSPNVRGRWGEIQLRRVVELAGMEEHCDFEVQQSVATEDGQYRPDLIVRLPGGRTVVVDAKAPVTAYLEAISLADESAREARLRDHAASVKGHILALGSKAYWEHVEDSTDFVVLFLPGESFFSAAVQQDPGLFEYGVSQRVFLAGPFTLLALLRTVAHGWSREKLAENARAISDLGKDLYERVLTMGEHFARLRRGLQNAVEAHNATVASLESRVLPAARRFRDLGVVSGKEIGLLDPIEHTPRRLQAADVVGTGDPEPAVDGEVVAASEEPLEPDAGD
jgi:DNA recombination protein RmuC